MGREETLKSLKYYQNIFLPLVLLSTFCVESFTIIDYGAEQELLFFLSVVRRSPAEG